MTATKLSQSATSKKQDQPNIALSKQIPGEYYLTSEQMDSMRHLVLAAQGIHREFDEQEESMALTELFLGFANGLSTIMEELQGQEISVIDEKRAGGAK